MTPDEINAKHGRASWRCNCCGAASGLYWWRGFSVAICISSQACNAWQKEKFDREMAEQDAWEEYVRENAPW